MSASEIPIWALTHLTHAALQRTADRVGADLLHVKGPATSQTLRPAPHDSSDADVLVRPAHLERFTDAMLADGWELFTDFADGSPFAHAANFVHPSWTYADIHRLIPGPLATPEAVFERLWRDHTVAEIAHQPVTVLSLPAQVLMQTLHAARSHGAEQPSAWRLCPDELRTEVRALSVELQTETAFAAGIGELDAHRNAVDHALWWYWSMPETDRLDEWTARLRSAPGIAEKWHVVRQAMRVNRTHLRLRLGHEPSRSEIAREQLSRLAQAARSVTRQLTRTGEKSA
ncbi:nucleotidyltransferase family protein [Microbacterium esteraromaticum]|uniref:nucleotidyltransferase family protein n=1 Tax=Microbacterium esteraromaticum TaxID=57043 RepID=UPI0023683095|nr:nucleotidyltransferase family protein [Microbacterium esteraromaticum]WDH79439.1 nucleotidyltransferase family protein [Microbacterium esteraromaticum]